MSLNERQEEIIEELRTIGKVDVETLATRFAVTAQTVRRDLGELCDRGLASRIHGGARRVVSTSSIGYEDRRLFNIDGKEKVGRIAAGLIPNECSLILNIGTTTEQVAHALTQHSGLVVISNNINVIQILRDSKLRDLVIVGGGHVPMAQSSVRMPPSLLPNTKLITPSLGRPRLMWMDPYWILTAAKLRFHEQFLKMPAPVFLSPTSRNLNATRL